MAGQGRPGRRVLAALVLWAVLSFASGAARAELVTFAYSAEYGGGTGDLMTALFSGTLSYDPSLDRPTVSATVSVNGTRAPVFFTDLELPGQAETISVAFFDYQENYSTLYFTGIGSDLPNLQPLAGSVKVDFGGSFNDEVNGQNTGNTNGGSNHLQSVSYELVDVHEPSSLAMTLAALGVAGFAMRAVRRTLPA